MFKKIIYPACFILLISFIFSSTANAADVTQHIFVSFDGNLDDTDYTPDPREFDTTGTFAAHNGTEIVSEGLGILTNDDGSDQESFQFDASEFNNNGIEFTGHPFVVEAVFTPTGSSGFMAPIIDIGGQCFIRFHNGLSAGCWNGIEEIVDNDIQPIPAIGEKHHYAIVYNGANIITYYLDGVPIFNSDNGSPRQITTLISWGNIRHTSVDGGRQLIGEYDAVAFSTFTGTFDPETDFILPEDPATRSLAFAPNPADEATDVLRDIVLGWMAGENAQTHDVYFGTVFDDVNEAGRDNPMGLLVSQNQEGTTYDPGRLELGQTFYWRVDEVAGNGTITKGDVWSFTVEPVGYPIAGENIIATASSSDRGKEPENTINGSGLDESGLLHDTIGMNNMWLSSTTGEQPTWIAYEFNKVYKLHEMWVWNSNESLESVIGLGIKEAVIEYSVDGVEYTTLGTTHEFARAPGAPDYEHNTSIDFGGIPVKYVKITVNSNWGGLLNQFGLSEVRFLSIPVDATKPSPESGATDIALDVTLGWKAGREAATHNVYLSDDMQAVADGSVPVATTNTASYGPLNLNFGTTYYWRVDEANEIESPDTWEGNIWNFTTKEYVVFDDFEDYNDYEPDRIFDAWVDGYGITTNGSTVGYPNPDFEVGEHFVETTIVHGGEQSMPYFYDNAAGNSEATMTLSPAGDWTLNGIGTLSLWYIGDVNNVSPEPMYVTLNGSATAVNEDANATLATEWTQWNIDLQVFVDQGANLANVSAITIGFGDNPPGGSGLVFIDDIRKASQQ